MGEVIDLATYAETSADSGGYKSGRNSDRDTPEMRSTSSTRKGGTSFHCETACTVTSSAAAILAKPPAASIARCKDRLRASRESFMPPRLSTALHTCQGDTPCGTQAGVYTTLMGIGERIRLARNQLGDKATQRWLAEQLDVSPQAICQWETGAAQPSLEKIAALRRALRVSFAWLHTGFGECPKPLDACVLADDAIDGLGAVRRRQARRKAPAPRKTSSGALAAR